MIFSLRKISILGFMAFIFITTSNALPVDQSASSSVTVQSGQLWKDHVHMFIPGPQTNDKIIPMPSRQYEDLIPRQTATTTSSSSISSTTSTTTDSSLVGLLWRDAVHAVIDHSPLPSARNA